MIAFVNVSQIRGSDTDIINRNGSTAEQMIKFAEATYNVTSGIGGLTVSVIDVEFLRDRGLLPASFPDKTPFGQEIKGFFVSSPDNINVIDVMITTTGSMDAKTLGKFDKKDTIESHNAIQEQAFLEMRRNELELDNNFNDDYYFGIIEEKKFESSGGLNKRDVDFFDSNEDEERKQPAILLKAPNQKGYWVFNIGGWMNSGTCSNANAPNYIDSSTGYRVCTSYSSVGNNVINRGFSYDCPATGIVMNEHANNSLYYDEFDKRSNGGSSGAGATYCLHAYKGDVDPNLGATFSRVIFNGHPDGHSSTYAYPVVVPKGTVPSRTFYDHKTSPGYYTPYNNLNVTTSGISGLNNRVYVHANLRGKMNPVPNFIFVRSLSVKANNSTYQIFNVMHVLNTGSGTYRYDPNVTRTSTIRQGVKINPSNKDRMSITMPYWRSSSDFNGRYTIAFDTPFM